MIKKNCSWSGWYKRAVLSDCMGCGNHTICFSMEFCVEKVSIVIFEFSPEILRSDPADWCESDLFSRWRLPKGWLRILRSRDICRDRCLPARRAESVRFRITFAFWFIWSWDDHNVRRLFLPSSGFPLLRNSFLSSFPDYRWWAWERFLSKWILSRRIK